MIINLKSLPKKFSTDSFLPLGFNKDTGESSFRYSIHEEPGGTISDYIDFMKPLPIDDYHNYFLRQGENVLVVGEAINSDQDARDLLFSGDFSTFDIWSTAIVGEFAFYQLKMRRTIQGPKGLPPSFIARYGSALIKDWENIALSAKNTRDNFLDAAENISAATAESSKNFGSVITFMVIIAGAALFIRLGGGRILSDVAKAKGAK